MEVNERCPWPPGRSVVVWILSTDPLLSPPGLLAEKDSNYCLCRTPCNLTRYGKELSMVKIPSKASAKYLAKKFNKSEQYTG